MTCNLKRWLIIFVLFLCSRTALAETNVLFISIDDLNDWIGCLGGHPQTHTPNIDRLAQRGTLFTNAHCAAPACNPSRAAVYSGLLPDRTGVWSNDSFKLPAHRPDLELLPTVFKKAGYITLGTGKLLHGGEKASSRVFDDGFYPEQRWSPLAREDVDYTSQELPTKKSDKPRHVVRRGGRPIVVLPLNGMPSDRAPDDATGESFDWGPFDVADGEMGDTKITDWSIEQLRREFGRPFFLGVGYYRPHIPLWAPRKYFDRLSRANIQLPPHLQTDLSDLPKVARRWGIEPVTAGSHETVVRFGQWKDAVMAYLACVSYVDQEVGRLLTALDNSAHSDNTLIVLWSDHGWHLGEKQHWGKWTGWERSTRVPLIIVPPKRRVGEFTIGSRCDRPVNLIDLYPTVAEICSVQPRGEVEGLSLVPLLRNSLAQPDRTSMTIVDRGNASLRTQSTRYIRYADGSEEFYDHATDPHEWTNQVDNEMFESGIRKSREQVGQWLTRSAEVD